MNGRVYEIAALCLRYVLAFLAVAIVGRALWMALKDHRRACKLRALEREVSTVGMLVPRRPRGEPAANALALSYPLLREGTMPGLPTLSGGAADSGEIRYEVVDGQLFLSSNGAPLSDRRGKAVVTLTVASGQGFAVGDQKWVFRLSRKKVCPRSPMGQRALGNGMERKSEESDGGQHGARQKTGRSRKTKTADVPF